MSGVRVGLIGTRIFQVIFAAVVLGVGANLAVFFHNLQVQCREDADYRNLPEAYCSGGRFPSSLDYSAFTGAWGLVDAFVGLAAAFVSSAAFGYIALGFDVLAAIFFFAGGVNLAVLYHDTLIPCSDSLFGSFCTQTQADTAFMFLGCVASLAAIGLLIVHNRSN